MAASRGCSRHPPRPFLAAACHTWRLSHSPLPTTQPECVYCHEAPCIQPDEWPGCSSISCPRAALEFLTQPGTCFGRTARQPNPRHICAAPPNPQTHTTPPPPQESNAALRAAFRTRPRPGAAGAASGRANPRQRRASPFPGGSCSRPCWWAEEGPSVTLALNAGVGSEERGGKWRDATTQAPGRRMHARAGGARKARGPRRAAARRESAQGPRAQRKVQGRRQITKASCLQGRRRGEGRRGAEARGRRSRAELPTKRRWPAAASRAIPARSRPWRRGPAGSRWKNFLRYHSCTTLHATQTPREKMENHATRALVSSFRSRISCSRCCS
jgi:hypothetical protein